MKKSQNLFAALCLLTMALSLSACAFKAPAVAPENQIAECEALREERPEEVFSCYAEKRSAEREVASRVAEYESAGRAARAGRAPASSSPPREQPTPATPPSLLPGVAQGQFARLIMPGVVSIPTMEQSDTFAMTHHRPSEGCREGYDVRITNGCETERLWVEEEEGVLAKCGHGNTAMVWGEFKGGRTQLLEMVPEENTGYYQISGQARPGVVVIKIRVFSNADGNLDTAPAVYFYTDTLRVRFPFQPSTFVPNPTTTKYTHRCGVR